MPIPGSSGLTLLAYYPGNPTNVATAVLNIPFGTLVVDTTTPALYQKTSTTDNSTFALLAIGTGGTFVSPAISNPTITGTLTLTGKLVGTPQALTAAGAVNLTSLVTTIASAGAIALTLADGVAGQAKVISMITDGGDATLTVANLQGGTTLTFNDVGDTVALVFVGTKWAIISNNGATLA